MRERERVDRSMDRRGEREVGWGGVRGARQPARQSIRFNNSQVSLAPPPSALACMPRRKPAKRWDTAW